MIILKSAEKLHQHLNKCRKKGITIGFVPTMGALHEGHLSLIKNSKSATGITVCSVYVNPTQFNDPKDFEKYPITVEEDIYKLESIDCDILFLPSTAEIYPDEADRKKHFPLGYLEEILEGKYRPGHFQGVCMVVERLLNIVEPDILYLGQKDFQQCMVVRKLLDLMGVKDRIELKISPTIREQDGLAMSSRNMRLNLEERRNAVTIYKTLLFLKENMGRISIDDIKRQAIERLEQHGFAVDYVELADSNTLQPIKEFDPKKKTVALIAAYLNDVRLIDNMVIID